MRTIEIITEAQERDIFPIDDISGIELRKGKSGNACAMLVIIRHKSTSVMNKQIFIQTNTSNDYLTKALEYYTQLKDFVFYNDHSAWKTMEIDLTNEENIPKIKYTH